MPQAFKNKILIVDDEPQILEILGEEFSDSYEVLKAESANEAAELLTTHRPDLVLLDINMPGKDGLTLCREVKENTATKEIPIFMISARSDSQSMVEAFNLGADDYIEKPYRVEVLKARINAKLKKTRRKGEVRCGNLTMLVNSREVRVDSQRIIFSELEFNLLRFFLENVNRTFTREEILKKVWQGEEISSRAVDTHLVSLRKNLKAFDHEIASLYGTGYVLRPRVRNPA